VWSIAAMISTAAVLVFVWRVQQPHEGMQITKGLAALPLLLVAGFVMLHRFWHRLPNRGSERVARRLAAANTLPAFLVLTPFALLAALTVVRGVFVPRGLLLFTPYLLLVLATGIDRIARRRAPAVAVAAVLMILHVESISAYWGRRIDPVDFHAFVEELRPSLRKGDVIFLRRHWAVTPVLFYLRPDRYSIYAQGYSEVTASHPGARVWVLVFYDNRTAPDAHDALRDYQVRKTVEAGPARAYLYSRIGQ
jgi:hypothetical protein